MIECKNYENGCVQITVKTAYPNSITELFDDPTFCDEIIGNRKLKIDIIHNDYDELQQSLYRLTQTDKDTYGWKSYDVSFKEVVKDYKEDEFEQYKDNLIRIFDETEFYGCWDSPFFDDIFSMYHSHKKEMWDSIYKYIADNRLLYDVD